MARLWALLRKHPGFRLARYELGLYRDLTRWVKGVQLIPDGADALPHPPGRLQMLGVLTAVLVSEMVAVHLLLPPGSLRLIALIISAWSFIYLWSLIASERIRPSYIAKDVIVLRRGRIVFAEVPTALIRSQRRERSFASDIEIEQGVLTLGSPAGTDTVVDLEKPIEAAKDRYPWQKPRYERVHQVRFYAGAKQS